MHEFREEKDFIYWLCKIFRYAIPPLTIIGLIWLVICCFRELENWFEELPKYEVSSVEICELDKCVSYSKEEIKEVSSGKWNTSVVFESGTKIVVDNSNIYVEYKRIN